MLNTDSKTKTLLKDSIWENLCGFELSKDFLATTRKHESQRNFKTVFIKI